MAQRHVFCDEWDGTRNIGESKIDPSWDYVVRKLEGLDGRRFTTVTVDYDDGKSLTVAGGNDGLFVCSFTDETKAQFPMLVATGKEKLLDEVKLTAGGQGVLYKRKYCVPIDTVTKVVKYFYEHGIMDQRFLWEDPDLN